MSNGEQPKATSCPNCQQPAIRSGNEITCEACDAVFMVTKKQGAKVKELGPIEDHERRIQALEGLHPAKQEPQKQEMEQEPVPDEDDDL